MGFFRGVRSTGSRARGGDGAWGGVALVEAADARGGSWATRLGLAEAAAVGRSLAAGEAAGEAAGAARADSCRGAAQNARAAPNATATPSASHGTHLRRGDVVSVSAAFVRVTTKSAGIGGAAGIASARDARSEASGATEAR